MSADHQNAFPGCGTPATPRLAELQILLRGDLVSIRKSVEQTNAGQAAFYIAVILIGAGLYGGAVGAWRSPLQGGFTAIKFPLIVLLTAFGNGLLNAMLAPLLGLNLGFRQSLMAILISFTMAATILGSFSPLVWFLTWNMPPLEAGGKVPFQAHALHLLTQIILIAFAGTAANLRLLQLLRSFSGSKEAARNVLLAWLAGNLLLGGQLSWMLRPFVGSPGLPVEFLRNDALHGNFFEAVFRTAKSLF
ncbi:MAG TPA: hypothetical protein VMZ27_04770 [Candidatus Saccharimonadales bacterium]|nr:hypothetical protein [Candidatus Saccharimonadales bacterium]